MINTFGQIILGLFAKLIVFHCHLPDKFEVLFKLFTLGQVVVVELHTSNMGIRSRTHTERRHSATVNIQRTIREEIEEQTIIRLLGVCDMLGEVVVVAYGVESRRVEDRE